MLTALSKLDVDALVTTGPNGEPTELGEPPSNLRIERYLPQSQVNARCAAAAGAGINAANAPARDLRGPLADPETLDADEIADALMRLLEDRGFAHAAHRLATEIEAMPEPGQTADLLESVFS